MTENEKYTIEVLAVALDTIEHLMNHAGQPQRTVEIARALDVNRTRVFRILKTLEAKGYAIADADTGQWELSLKCLEIGERVREKYDVRRIAMPFIRELAQRTGDMVEIVALDRDQAVIVDGYRGGHRLQVTTAIGRRFPLHVGASPKLLLAYAPSKERERLLQLIDLTGFTLNTITDRGALRHCLEIIRAQGYAVDVGEFEDDICAVGAPIRDHTGRVIAGLTVSVPASRFTRQRRQETTALTVETAQRISAGFGPGIVR